MTIIAPSTEETNAIAELHARLQSESDEVDARVAAIERDAARLRALRDQTDILPEITAKMEADRKAIASTIASGQSIVPDDEVTPVAVAEVTPVAVAEVTPVAVPELPRARPFAPQAQWTRRD
jgi:hypothetical protein